jgi:hypothetical protein
MFMYAKVEFKDLVKGERYFIRYGPHQWITGKLQNIEVYATFSSLKKNSFFLLWLALNLLRPINSNSKGCRQVECGARGILGIVQRAHCQSRW